MKLSFILATCLLASSFASAANECEPGILSSASSVICAVPEMKAYEAVLNAGLKNDIQKLNGSLSNCQAKPSKAIRILDAIGNHFRDVQVLILTEVTCTRPSDEFIIPLFQYPILVKMRVHNTVPESEVVDIVVQKLYDANERP